MPRSNRGGPPPPAVSTVFHCADLGLRDAPPNTATHKPLMGLAPTRDSLVFSAFEHQCILALLTPARLPCILSGAPGITGHRDGPRGRARYSKVLRDLCLDTRRPELGKVFVADAGNGKVRARGVVGRRV